MSTAANELELSNLKILEVILGIKKKKKPCTLKYDVDGRRTHSLLLFNM